MIWFRQSQIIQVMIHVGCSVEALGTRLDMKFIEIKVINCIDPQNCSINYLDTALLSGHGRVTQNIRLVYLRLMMRFWFDLYKRFTENSTETARTFWKWKMIKRWINFFKKRRGEEIFSQGKRGFRFFRLKKGVNNFFLINFSQNAT